MGNKSYYKTYKQFQSEVGFKSKVREAIRDKVIFGLSALGGDFKKRNWIRFPYYHHVFDDECTNFSKQLQYMKNLGDFITIDNAIDLLKSDQPLDGRYFCITFDDGFKNSLTNALPILLKHQAPAAFFIATQFIGHSSDVDMKNNFPSNSKFTIEFLTWEDCAQLVKAGMTIGSHTENHLRLSSLSAAEVTQELSNSKMEIEKHLPVECLHFCAPVGIPDKDFLTDRDPAIAHSLGYRSFLSGKRGAAKRKSTPMLIERDHMLAIWDNYQLRYFFSH